MNTILEHDCYRDVILAFVKETHCTQRQIAQESGIHTSYFSRVMKLGADFSNEQLYAIGKVLGLYNWRLDYFLLLGDLSRSGLHSHKTYIKNKIDECRRMHSKVIDKLQGVCAPLSEENIATYYSSTLTARVHMLLTIPKFRFHVMMLQKKLRISEKLLGQELKKLEQLKIISREGGEIKVLKRSIHLEESHPASIDNHRNWRIETLHKLSHGEASHADFHLSATFSGNEKTKIQIKEILKQAIVESQKKVRDSQDLDDVFHIGIDLY
ncbi:DUF4423 domain-containing protein [Pseudobacteriovorax antillogorgiicola]|uniref:DUF4423 domain-containing protein n=1 Tax=Pseudobacteriovorax antillogorgiicola TaxID=1513793 RepID=A0A1Y6C1X9_9BACT|nr:DUF4423 domain-containing protein [Pseudobacteriovorax antillogorgiicola]TCS50207.1 uncharacterized protein DUF4423 [Pseudobacteriovorax antillogorgiicola]SMF32319.1 protein of unknown function [Pseudobacteriovorax antillogorgiicola]